MPIGKASELRLRILSACLFSPAILVLAYLGGAAFFALVLFVALRGTWEFYSLASVAGFRPRRHLGLASVLGLCSYFYFLGFDHLEFPLVIVIVLGLLLTLRAGTEGYVVNVFLTVGGALYTGFLGGISLLLDTALEPHGIGGRLLLIALFSCIGLTDAGAYACGRLWGKRKLAPSISPGKTIVGFVGGLVVGQLPLLLVGHIHFLSLLPLSGLLLLVSATGQLGDLVESAIKRDFGVKDAPPLIPGHGGILDRFDSYLVAFPLAYLYLELGRTLGWI
jgi:phosphatidate cytidylyltransferase